MVQKPQRYELGLTLGDMAVDRDGTNIPGFNFDDVNFAYVALAQNYCVGDSPQRIAEQVATIAAVAERVGAVGPAIVYPEVADVWQVDADRLGLYLQHFSEGPSAADAFMRALLRISRLVQSPMDVRERYVREALGTPAGEGMSVFSRTILVVRRQLEPGSYQTDIL